MGLWEKEMAVDKKTGHLICPVFLTTRYLHQLNCTWVL